MLRTKIAMVAITATLLLSACAGLTPENVLRGVGVHRTFPTLSLAIQQCVADEPEVQAQMVQPFNALVDKWQIARDKGTEQLIIEGTQALRHMNEIGVAWADLWQPIDDAGIDCGPGVNAMRGNAELVFKTVNNGLKSNERLMTYLEMGSLAASVVMNPQGKVVKMVAGGAL